MIRTHSDITKKKMKLRITEVSVGRNILQHLLAIGAMMGILWGS